MFSGRPHVPRFFKVQHHNINNSKALRVRFSASRPIIVNHFVLELMKTSEIPNGSSRRFSHRFRHIFMTKHHSSSSMAAECYDGRMQCSSALNSQQRTLLDSIPNRLENIRLFFLQIEIGAHKIVIFVRLEEISPKRAGLLPFNHRTSHYPSIVRHLPSATIQSTGCPLVATWIQICIKSKICLQFLFVSSPTTISLRKIIIAADDNDGMPAAFSVWHFRCFRLASKTSRCVM